LLEVVLDEVLGEVSPAEAAADEGVLGRDVGDAPGVRREHAVIGGGGIGGGAALGEHDLDGLGEVVEAHRAR
jgi:hypothetical protein